MRPPKPTVARAGHIFFGVGFGMVMAMIGCPRQRRAGAIEHRTENQNLLHDRVEFERAMRQAAVITNGCANATDDEQSQGDQRHTQAGKRKQKQANEG